MKRFTGNRFILLGILLVGLGFMLATPNPARGIVLINDDTRVNNRVEVESRTGGNRNENGNTQTGDANIGGVNVGTYTNTTIVTCCTPTPENPNPTTTGSQNTPTPPSGQPTATPTPTGSSGGGNGGGNGDNGSGGGTGGGDVTGAKTEQGDILGLAATSSINMPASFIQGLGLLCVGIGLTLKRKIALG